MSCLNSKPNLSGSPNQTNLTGSPNQTHVKDILLNFFPSSVIIQHSVIQVIKNSKHESRKESSRENGSTKKG